MPERPKLTVYIEPEDIVNRVLDEEEYKGKTLREWADTLTNPKTQADRIRAMSDEELAERIHGLEFDSYTHAGSVHSAAWWFDWLRSPAEESK